MPIEREEKIFLYTMTAGLGDYLIMGDVMRKIEHSVLGAKCLMIHRGNPHVALWPHEDNERFFNVYSWADVMRLVGLLRGYRKAGFFVFGLQIAPGSWQGYALHSALKRLQALDRIVEFNLANADIIIPSEGDYILNIHLNQVKRLLGRDICSEQEHLDLPLAFSARALRKNVIGVHPWSRRGGDSFTWSWDKWAKVISFLVEKGDDVVVFGKDENFIALYDSLAQTLPAGIFRKVLFEPSRTVADMTEQITSFDGIVSVNTAVVHIGYALGKRMVILNGPTLELWIPKAAGIISLHDRETRFPGGDKVSLYPDLPQLMRIDVKDVLVAISENFREGGRT